MVVALRVQRAVHQQVRVVRLQRLALLARLADPGYRARPERAILFTVEAWDVNCPQHITARFTANEVADAPGFERRLGGTGGLLDPLEWDVKVYFTLNGAVHDAAIAAWGLKGFYDSVRPISMIRYLGGQGQSSDPAGPAYDPAGLPLEPGLVEVITPESSAPGQRHEDLADHVGEVAVFEDDDDDVGVGQGRGDRGGYAGEEGGEGEF